MTLHKIPYNNLKSLIRIHLSTKENPQTQETIKKLLRAKKRGYLNKSELEIICLWKSPRAIRHIKRNRENTIINTTKAAFRVRSERIKLELLTSLHGVSVPMASSILTLLNPWRYGIIDIRVWQLLYALGSVNKNAKGVNFDFNQWYRYLVIIRYYARHYKVKARDIERTLFYVHGIYQKGLLYK